MKRFRFSLQAVHTLRQRQEQVALEAYSRALRARQLARDRLQAVERELELAWAARRACQSQPAPAARLRAANEFCAFLDDQRLAAASHLRTAQQAVDAAWKKLVLARQRREAVEKYRQRQWREHQAATQRAEQKWLDEIAQRRAVVAGAWAGES